MDQVRGIKTRDDHETYGEDLHDAPGISEREIRVEGVKMNARGLRVLTSRSSLGVPIQLRHAEVFQGSQ
jgi:hypothetical protein